MAEMERKAWSKDLKLGMTIYMDMKTHKPVLFLGGGSEIEGKQGLVAPIACDNPFDIPKHYGAMVSAMAETITLHCAMNVQKELEKLLDD